MQWWSESRDTKKEAIFEPFPKEKNVFSGPKITFPGFWMTGKK